MMFENKQKCLQNKTTHRYRNIIKFKCVKMTIYLLVAEKFLFLLQSPWQKNWNKNFYNIYQIVLNENNLKFWTQSYVMKYSMIYYNIFYYTYRY